MPAGGCWESDSGFGSSGEGMSKMSLFWVSTLIWGWEGGYYFGVSGTWAFAFGYVFEVYWGSGCF